MVRITCLSLFSICQQARFNHSSDLGENQRVCPAGKCQRSYALLSKADEGGDDKETLVLPWWICLGALDADWRQGNLLGSPCRRLHWLYNQYNSFFVFGFFFFPPSLPQKRGPAPSLAVTSWVRWFLDRLRLGLEGLVQIFWSPGSARIMQSSRQTQRQAIAEMDETL